MNFRVVETLTNTSCSELPIGSIVRITKCGITGRINDHMIITKFNNDHAGVVLIGNNEPVLNSIWVFDCEVLRYGTGNK